MTAFDRSSTTGRLSWSAYLNAVILNFASMYGSEPRDDLGALDVTVGVEPRGEGGRAVGLEDGRVEAGDDLRVEDVDPAATGIDAALFERAKRPNTQPGIDSIRVVVSRASSTS